MRVPPQKCATDPVQIFNSKSLWKAGCLGKAGLLRGSGEMWMGCVVLGGLEMSWELGASQGWPGISASTSSSLWHGCVHCNVFFSIYFTLSPNTH